MTDTTTVSLGAELDWAAGHLGGSAPAREARTLWAAISGREPGAVWLHRETDVDPGRARAFRHAVRRCAAGEPTEYVVGRAAFRTIELEVDSRVLIPRPETEGLVDRVLAWSGATGRWGRAAEIGAGSGCVILSLATEGRFASLVATERSGPALAVANRNARVIAPGQISLLQGDLLAGLRDDVFDVIVSNPPYISEDEYEHLDASVKDWEPWEALVGGSDGNRDVLGVCRAAAAQLTAGGLLALEIDARRSAAAVAAARGVGLADVRVERDVFGRERYLTATRKP